MATIALIAVLVMGATAVSAGFGTFDAGLPFLAQKGNGNGNGGNSGENPPNPPGTGNNGQGQGQENGNPPVDPGSGNNRQGGGNGNGNAEAPEVVETGDAQAAPASAAPEKVDVCHVTNATTGDAVLINISENAVPAHERHGDTVIGDEATAACGETDETSETGEAVDATPIPGEPGGDEDAEGTEAGTPVASPVASPATDEDND